MEPVTLTLPPLKKVDIGWSLASLLATAPVVATDPLQNLAADSNLSALQTGGDGMAGLIGNAMHLAIPRHVGATGRTAPPQRCAI